MLEGDRIADRWQLVVALPPRDGVERWRATAIDTGEPAEVLFLPAAADAQARTQFQDLHRVLSRVSDPALAKTLDQRYVDGRPVVVRTALETPTLAEVRTPLDSATVAWIGSALAPAVLAAGPATRGALRSTDVALDASGHPILAPRIEPLTRVALGSTRCVAPESFGGAPPDGASGLYGLGVVLYELVTGREPPISGPPGRRPPPPPPSTLRHGVPETLDRAILRLMSPEPGARIGAVPMLQELAGAPVDLRPLVRGPVRTEVRYGAAAAAPRSAREDRDPGGLVILAPRELARLDGAGRNLLAGVARLPLDTLDALKARGLPVVLETTAGASAARARAAEIRRTAGLPVVAAAPGGLAASVWLATAVAASLLPAGLGLILLAFGFVPFAVVLFALAAVMVGAGWLGGRLGSAGRYGPALASLATIRDARSERASDGPLGPAWARLAALRLEVARADVPPAVSIDLRDALKEIEDELESLAQVARTAERTLRQVDLPALRTRLATLSSRAGSEEGARVERDRVARTVADLEAVQAQAAALADENSRMLDRLGEISAALAQLGTDADEDELSALGAAARRARDASIEGEARLKAAAARARAAAGEG